MRASSNPAVAGLLLCATSSSALDLDLNSTSSIKAATKTIAANVMQIYEQSLKSDGIPGLFALPMYWWEGGLAFDSLINYWAQTGDATYNDQVSKGMLWQIGSNNDFLLPNQTESEGNDDQSFWALAAMTAAEVGFPAPPASSGLQSWVELAQNVFDEQALRWNNKTCGGGLRWQIYTFNQGYDYMNAASNGNFFQLASRLARYTGNNSYAEWANRAQEWAVKIKIVNDDNVYDGTSTTTDCKDISKIQWTSNYGTYLTGYSYLGNLSSSQSDSATVASNLVQNIKNLFASTPATPKDGIITETTCNSTSDCPGEYQTYRAILARALATTSALTTDSFVRNEIQSLVQTSALGAASQCSGGSAGTTCGVNWASSKYDGTTGLGQELSALNIILANLPAAKLQTSSGKSSKSGSSTSVSSSSATPSASSSSMPLQSTSTTVSTTASGTPSPTSPSAGSTTPTPNSASDVSAYSLGALAALGLAMAAIA